MISGTPISILVVDDEGAVRRVLHDVFEEVGYIVLEASNASEALEQLRQHPVNLITLDLHLAGEDGLALFHQVRASFNIPIVMVTARLDAVDRIVGLELGADDYIVKPFNVREVLARVRAVLRRYTRATKLAADVGSTITFGDWALNTATRELQNVHGQSVALTTAEFDLLVLFTQRPSRVLSRDALIDVLKGRSAAPFDRSIDTLVARLRKKIEIDIRHPAHIKTVHGVGYLFAAQPRKK